MAKDTSEDPNSVKAKIEWPSAPSTLSMQAGAVHVWAWNYHCSTESLKRYISLLSPEECLRMQRFHFERDRIQYAVCHAVLRIVLGQYIGLPPSSFCFDQNEFGRPHLAPPAAASGLTFNLSHTRHIALLAIATGITLGVDVEQIHPIESGLVEQYFSSQEQTALKALEGEDRLKGFYNCWTRKEAILKAEGNGLKVRLDAFDVSLNPKEQATVLGVRAGAGLMSNWHLTELRPAPGFVGALATDAPPAKVIRYRFEG
jgi:4'-phosphopantetheinyl transferase